MSAEPRRYGSPDVPAKLSMRDVYQRYPALDRVVLTFAAFYARNPAAASVLCGYALHRSLADDAVAFLDDALLSAAQGAATLGIRGAVLHALDRMPARSRDHRVARDAVRAALSADETPLAAWFAGPATIVGALLAALAPSAGRTLAFGTNGALLVAYAPERSWSYGAPGAPLVAARRYAPGTFSAAVVADPCDEATRAPLLDETIALGIPRAYTVELPGGSRAYRDLVGETLVASLAVPSWPVLNSTALWQLPIGGTIAPGGAMLVDIVAWSR